MGALDAWAAALVNAIRAGGELPAEAADALRVLVATTAGRHSAVQPGLRALVAADLERELDEAFATCTTDERWHAFVRRRPRALWGGHRRLGRAARLPEQD